MNAQHAGVTLGVAPIERAREIISELEFCERIDRMMHSDENIAAILGAVEVATGGKVTVVKHTVEIFPNNAFTLLAVLSASSLSIHCWPEYHLLDLNIYMCQGYEDGSDNGPYAESLHDHYVAYFDAKKVSKGYRERGPRPRSHVP